MKNGSHVYDLLEYRDLYDIPRAFIISTEAQRLLYFDCPFDSCSDEYSSFFEIFELKVSDPSLIPHDWREMGEIVSRRLGRVQANQITFDASCRKSIALDFGEMVRGGAGQPIGVNP